MATEHYFCASPVCLTSTTRVMFLLTVCRSVVTKTMYAVTVVFQQLNTLSSNNFLEIGTSIREALLISLTFIQRASVCYILGVTNLLITVSSFSASPKSFNNFLIKNHSIILALAALNCC